MQTESARAKQHQPVDLVLRTPEHAKFYPGVRLSVILEHNRIVQDHQRVLLGKFGAALKGARLKALHWTDEAGSVPRLILVMIVEGDFVGYAAPIVSIRTAPPTSTEEHLIPEYYDRLDGRPSTWIELGGPLERTELTGLELVNSGRQLTAVLPECRT